MRGVESTLQQSIEHRRTVVAFYKSNAECLECAANSALVSCVKIFAMFRSNAQRSRLCAIKSLFSMTADH